MKLDIEIRKFILRALLAAKGTPLPDDSLRAAITGAFPQVAFTDADLRQHIKDAQETLLIDGTNDEVTGIVWALTPNGKIHAQRL